MVKGVSVLEVGCSQFKKNKTKTFGTELYPVIRKKKIAPYQTFQGLLKNET